MQGEVKPIPGKVITITKKFSFNQGDGLRFRGLQVAYSRELNLFVGSCYLKTAISQNSVFCFDLVDFVQFLSCL